ncbi:hypothetical protein GCM10010357_52240 [Streptomyces luteireticuli]|uniref:Uncharacterized protein n=1 Tax=Streptomyces luteireticuli TaxID=173858 RepID=A0ABN0Z022_9ACTN
MRAHGDTQGAGQRPQGKEERGLSRPQQGEADREGGGEGGVVAGEGPVARWRARADGGDAVQRAAGPLLVDDRLEELADGVGGDGRRAGEQHPGEQVRLAAAQGGPAGPHQQQPQHHQGSLGGQGQQRARPAGGVRRRAGDGAVQGGGRSRGDQGPARGARGVRRGPGQRPAGGGEGAGRARDAPAGGPGAVVSYRVFHDPGRYGSAAARHTARRARSRP